MLMDRFLFEVAAALFVLLVFFGVVGIVAFVIFLKDLWMTE